MATKDLITLARAKQDILDIVDGTYDTQLAVLITAASDAIEKYLRRSVYSRTLDELYNGEGQHRLILREYPVQAIASIRYNRSPVLRISNTATSTNQRATVEVTSTGLRLVRVASGVVTTDATVLFATYVTLTAVATAVTALGSGWSASVVSPYNLWPSADLYHAPSAGDGVRSMGALNCRGVQAGLTLHVDELSDFQFDQTRGWVMLGTSDLERDLPEWQGGQNAYRVIYTAGYTTIPEALQLACAKLVNILWYETDRDQNLQSSVSGTNVKSYIDWIDKLPHKVLALLAPYRRHTIASERM